MDEFGAQLRSRASHAASPSLSVGEFAISLANTPIGLLMLRLVGQSYVTHADIYRAAPHEEPVRRMSAFMQSTARSARAVSAGVGVLSSANAMMRDAKKAKAAKEAEAEAAEAEVAETADVEATEGEAEEEEAAGTRTASGTEAASGEAASGEGAGGEAAAASWSEEAAREAAAGPAPGGASGGAAPGGAPSSAETAAAPAAASSGAADGEREESEGDELEDEALHQFAQQHMGGVLKLMWRVLKLEVEEVLSRATHKLLYDKAVDRATRIKRAQALRVLGNAMAMTSSAPLERRLDVELPPGTRLAVRRHAETGAAALDEPVPSITAAAADGDAAELRAGDVLVAVGGVDVVGYAHALDVAPALLSGEPTAEALRLTVTRELLAGRYRTFNMAIAAQLSGPFTMGAEVGDPASLGLPPSPPARPGEAEPKLATWAESSGRHGPSEGYSFGDLSRGLARTVGARLSRSDSAEDSLFLAEADKAGRLGKRSNNLHEWNVRWLCVHGERLAWYNGKDGGLRGKVNLRGAVIGTDDFGAHQAFTITISKYDGRDGKPIYLSARSLREQLAWTAALKRAASLGVPAESAGV